MKKHDIVYLYKATDSKELMYSLRSVEANLPYNKVWIYGDKPKNIEPDCMIEVVQRGFTAGERTYDMIKQACNNPDITDDFWLMNDDFFILEKVTSVRAMFSGQLSERIASIEHRHKDKQTAYTKLLRKAEARLKRDGHPTKAFDAVHSPMLINKEKAKETIEMYPDIVTFRSMYGNMHNVSCKKTGDAKITSTHDLPKEGQQFVSTNEESFRRGAVGKYIRKQFRKPSRFEVRADG